MTWVSPITLSVLAGLAAAAATLLWWPRRARWTDPRVVAAPPNGAPALDSAAGAGWLARFRWVLSTLAGVGGASFAPGALWLPAGVAVAAGVWMAIGRAEPLDVRREREQANQDLAPLVDLIAVALAAGAPAETALRIACEALPGAAARRLTVVRAELALGSDADRAWSSLTDDDVLAPLGRTIIRANRAGAPIAATVSRLAVELAAKSRADVEDRARVVGVKAAVPLGVCLLPSFLLIGIVPVAAGLLGSLT